MSDGDNISELLNNLGVSRRESAAYLKLIKQKGAFPSYLAGQCGINRTTMYVLLDELQKKGLIKRNLSHGQKYYQALEPSSFIAEQRRKQEVIDQTLNELETVLSELTSDSNATQENARAITNLEKALQYTIERIEAHITSNAAIFLVDEEESVIRPFIFTGSNLAQFITKRTGKIRALSVEITNKENLISKCVRENKIQSSEEINDFLQPTIPVSFAKLIQKRGKLIQATAIPIKINEKIIGVALLGFNKSQNKKKNLDEILSITEDGGIKIFHSLRHERKNKLLHQAHKHLTKFLKNSPKEKQEIKLLLANINKEIGPGV